MEAFGKRPMSVFVFGAPGTGKSCVLNYLIDGQGSEHFKSSNSACSGVTKEISICECQAFGNYDKRLKLIDFPGVGDFNICLDQLVIDVKLKIGHEQIIDAVLLVIKSTDYRITV